MAGSVWYGPHELEVGSAVHERLTKEGATFTDAAPGGEPTAGYGDLKVDELQALADERALDVEGSGSGGAVVKADLVAALEADDESAGGGTLGG